MNNPKIVVAIPEQQHSFKLISSLKRLGYDTTYITSVYFKNRSLLLRILKVILPEKTYKRACGRHCEGFDDNKVIVYYPALGLFQLLMQRVSTKCYRKIRKLKWSLFQRKVVEYCKRNPVDILILYEDYSSFVISELCGSNIKIVIDCSAASKTYMKEIYEKDEGGKNIDQFKREYPVLWDQTEDINQFLKCDRILVPSTFSKRSYMAIGVNEDKIHVVGYPLDFKYSAEGKKPPHERLRLVYSGQVTFRKGIHHLLEAVTILQNEFPIEVLLYGSFDKSSLIYKKYRDNPNIYFKGWVLHDELFKQLEESDVFVFPSLADSMSFSCLEAMYIGLPVICTNNTGASDYIENKINGIVVNASSQNDLIDAIRWCYRNRNCLIDMGNAAKKQAIKRTDMEVYDKGIHSLIKSI